MSDTPTPPIDAETAEVLAVAKRIVRAWHGCKAGGGYVGRALRVVDRWSGPVALALVLLGFQDCHPSLPNIPWLPWNRPTPTPVPPQPPSPIPGDGLRLLVVYDTATLSHLPKEQAAVLTSTDFQAFLKSANAQAMFLDPNTDMSGYSEPWIAAMKRPRKSLPWIVVGNGTTGYEGPLPPTVAETQALVNKFVRH